MPRRIICDRCGTMLTEGDFIKSYYGGHYCESCWRLEVMQYLVDEYIPNHLKDLLVDAAAEMEDQG